MSARSIFSKKLSDHLCGYRKGYITHYALLKLIGNWKKIRYVTQLPLIAKLHAYGLRGKSLKLLWDYLSNRSQRTKVNGSYSTCEELLAGAPQGSVLGPPLFNIYFNDMFYTIERTDICNLADGITPYSSHHLNGLEIPV